MNLMESRRGFYEGGSKCTLPFSQSSSSSSSSRQKAPLHPFSYNHHQQQRPPWIDDNQDSLSHHQTELTMGGGDTDGDDLEDHQVSVIHGGPGGGEGGVGGVGGVVGGGESSGGTLEVIEREHMFDKVVTPSDVGKLNRLVIPKQQAEKYFPLDSSTNDKGLLLNFEDRNGKPWRFRYSYWKSSQSYVMTKGWSRFVKEKKLDAGDVVSFQRGVGEFAKDRLFIDWRRRRPEPPNYPHELPPIPAFSLSTHFSLRPWNHHHHHHHNYQHPPHLMQPSYPVISPHQSHHYNTSTPYSSYGNANVYGPGAGSVVYLKSTGGISCGGGGGGGVGASQQQLGMLPIPMPIPPSMVYESVPVVQRKAAPKKLRLFGVNMECPMTENNEREILSSTTLPHFSTITPSHRPNSSDTSFSSRPYYHHQTNPQRFFQENPNDDKGNSSRSLDLDI